MTTIACNRFEMAADSQVTYGNISVPGARKLFRASWGDVIAVAGLESDALPFVEWYEAGSPRQGKPELDEEFAAIVLTPDGLKQYRDTLAPYPVVGEFFALGSGMDLALGAMAHGASPKEAVEIACRYDIYTGLPVVVEKL